MSRQAKVRDAAFINHADLMTRIEREKNTVAAMIGMYCRGNHAAGAAFAGGRRGSAEQPEVVSSAPEALCDDCRELLDYAMQRLSRCPHGASKPSCKRCTIHCYSPQMRQRIAAVMRWSGPRMMLRHPVMALRHLLR